MDWEIKHFKDLSPEELYNILKLRSEIFVVEQQCIYLDCDDKDKVSYQLFRKNQQGEIIASVRILPKGISYNESSIGRVVVRKDYRRKGIASEMMKVAMEFIKREFNEGTIRISAQLYLLEFYRSVGFLPVSEPYLEDNIPHIEMLHREG
ncbi:MAG: GNAT family N-acetyltransferase [Clostridiales bacterium]|uniref:GNAT family N-acetyltransferase n=1 Tax=Clostridium sp. N3C TaxID=1776758 RepID=UPI00092E0277|nr:GNAT family N-acetyltransferase [Clostridium sp. N3C]NLZ48785.1 GNAT family N-acetyltransferase [Clostridiales bacterium]SCN22036.1 putative acyltransferase [Clostridium sp. N3C]